MEYLKMNRRKFVGALGLGTAHILFSNPLFAANPGRFASSNPVQKIKLGKSGVETSLLGVGTGVHAGNRTSFLTKQDKQKSLALIQHSYDKGIRNFDCADTYGTHAIVAEALAKKDRKEVVEVIQQLHKAGKGVIGMKLVGNGDLSNDSKKIDDSLRFVLGLGSVDMMIVGFESTEQIDNYIGRVEKSLVEINRG